MNWIKCSERLPEIGNAVLIHNERYQDDYLEIASRQMRECFWLDTISESSDWGCKSDWHWDRGYDGTIPLCPRNVTHWMPLPQAPKGE